MDDDDQSSGLLGSYAWWQLGRWSAENQQQEHDAIAKLTGTAPVPVQDFNHALHVLVQWRAECQRLQQVNANLQAQLNAANAHVAELKVWGSNWRNVAEERRQQTLMMGARADRFEDELERLKGST